MSCCNLLDLRKFLAPETVFGSGAGLLAGRYIQNLGARSILLVTDPGVAAQDWFGDISTSLTDAGLEVHPFMDVTSNPRDFEAVRGAGVYRDNACDAIVAVGGGSAMDCAKVIGIISANDLPALDFAGVDNVPHPGPPLICIPSTAGSAAEMSQFAIITDTARNAKIAIVSKAMVPDTALVDPAFTTTMPEDITRYTGVDALTHAIEAYVSNARATTTDLFAVEALRLIARHLPRVLAAPNDIEERAAMMLGSVYAGLAFSNAILGAGHAMAHSLGGLLDLPHGLCNAILLDHVVAYNFEAEPDRYTEIARILGANISDAAPLDERRQAAVEQFRTFKRNLGVTASLADVGVRPEHLDRLTAAAMADLCMVTNPKPPTAEEIRAVYEDAL